MELSFEPSSCTICRSPFGPEILTPCQKGTLTNWRHACRREVPTRISCTWWCSHVLRRRGTAAGCCSPCQWSCIVASPRSPACHSAPLPCYPPVDAARWTSSGWCGSSFCFPSQQAVYISRRPAVNWFPSPGARWPEGSAEKGSSCPWLSGEKCKKSLLSSSNACRVQITCCSAAHWPAGWPIATQEGSARKSLQSSSSPVNETHRRVSANVVSAVVLFPLPALSRLPRCRVLVSGT